MRQPFASRGASLALALAAAGLSMAVSLPAFAAQETQRAYQQQQTDANGRLTVEAAYIHVIACNGAGENGRQFYVYQYANRRGFRAIAPPNWGRAIGGRDFGTFQESVAAACRGGGYMPGIPPKPPGNTTPKAPHWVAAGVRDCMGDDDKGADTSGLGPSAAMCTNATLGKIVICWDGQRYQNNYEHPRAYPWCRYKMSGSCNAGNQNPGQSYVCQR
jgi:hypothetical protein